MGQGQLLALGKGALPENLLHRNHGNVIWQGVRLPPATSKTMMKARF